MPENDILALQAQVERGEAMQRLFDNEDFVNIFQKHFIEAWGITNTMNIANYDQQTKQRTFEKMNARSVFATYCQDTIEEGNMAAEALRSTEELAE